MVKAFVVKNSSSSFAVSTNLHGSEERCFSTAGRAIAYANRLMASGAVSTFEVYIDGYSIGGDREDS